MGTYFHTFARGLSAYCIAATDLCPLSLILNRLYFPQVGFPTRPLAPGMLISILPVLRRVPAHTGPRLVVGWGKREPFATRNPSPWVPVPSRNLRRFRGI